ncbi:MAG: hypothetical protein Kow0068_19290 [Marinilabiliales bacterium]
MRLILIAVVLTVISFKLLNIYLINDYNFISGLLFAPLILYIPDKNVKSNRFAWIGVVMTILYLFFPVLTLFYFAFTAAILYFIETNYGKLNNLIFIYVVILSSFTRYIINVFSFPLRLKLTSITGNLLNFIGFENVVKGNVIIHNGINFSVDQECMGLKMVITSFLIMMLFVSFFEKRNRGKLNISGLIAIVMVNTVLIIITNLMRIAVLLVFKSHPGTLSHDFLGIFSLFLYNIIPLYIITPFIISFFAKKIYPKPPKTYSKRLSVILFIFFIISFFIIKLIYNPLQQTIDYQTNIIIPDNYQKDTVKNNIIKLYNKNALIYIKPPAKFYSSDHSPYICWQGCGYDFKNIETSKINNYEVYIAELVSENDKLYTAWWYNNGKDITINQIKWRWNTLKGEAPYYLYNVTSNDKATLFNEIKTFINE